MLSCLIGGQTAAASYEHELLQQLRADYVVYLQARTEFEQLYPQGKSASNARDDFAAWVRQLSGQVEEGCRKVLSISTSPLPADLPCDEFLVGRSTPAAINIAAEKTEDENTARMIDELNGSLGEFDERLLREQDRVKAKKPRTETDSASSGGGGAGGAGSSGDAAADGEGEKGTQSETGGGKSASESGRAGSVEEGQPGSSSQKGVQGKSLPGTKSSAPADIPDGSNDDVIARQLREAAEKETDPELKKKLWDEYRRYKSGEL